MFSCTPLTCIRKFKISAAKKNNCQSTFCTLYLKVKVIVLWTFRRLMANTCEARGSFYRKLILVFLETKQTWEKSWKSLIQGMRDVVLGWTTITCFLRDKCNCVLTLQLLSATIASIFTSFIDVKQISRLALMTVNRL